MEKNRLQEFCQKYGSPLPEYKTINNELNTFISSVTIVYKDEKYTKSGKACISKKEAEMTSAENMLKY